MKTLRILKTSLLLLLLFSCQKDKDSKLRDVFSSENGKKWYIYSIDSAHSFYPYRVSNFFSDGKQIEYINNSTTKNLDRIPKDNMYNPEKWFIINDSVVSIETVFNPTTKSYHKENRKVLFYNKDTIILQGTKRDNYEGILILTRYKEKESIITK
ncbi:MULTISPECIES: hypothetical protein [Chryseobacterium]|uniref:Lipoprotein n=1 Tax=Chryseobacterium candidae TaxID=1978493 RepID=A0ABY2R435_9FLAO|nr:MULTISPECIES: hypothetical protein [Chryseobacterium]THV56804.1 hypothetical protein EK417_17355 [Chryseobacterium candidae]